MISKSQTPMTVRAIEKAIESGRLRTDLCIQRNGVWDTERKSLFIHSLLYGYPVPPIYVQVETDGVLWALDGKQRISAVLEFIKNRYFLHEDTPMVGNVDIAGKLFTELPEEYQHMIKNETSFSVYRLENLSDIERDEMFMRLNNGVSLTKFELTRALAQGKVMSFIQELAQKPFFTTSVALTDSMRLRMVDQELVLAVVMQYMSEDAVGLSGNELRNFALSLKDTGVPLEVQQKLLDTADYLWEAFPERCRFLKKAHVPTVFQVAARATTDGHTPREFECWATRFFSELAPGNEYSTACRSGSAKREHVKRRFDIMLESYMCNIGWLPDAEATQAEGSELFGGQDEVSV